MRINGELVTPKFSIGQQVLVYNHLGESTCETIADIREPNCTRGYGYLMRPITKNSQWIPQWRIHEAFSSRPFSRGQ